MLVRNKNAKSKDIKLVNMSEECDTLISDPHWPGFQRFANELAAIERRKARCTGDNLTYVGRALLDDDNERLQIN